MAESGAREPATHAIGVRVTAAQFAWLSQQPGTSGSEIRRLLDREVARGAAPGNGRVSRTDLLEVAAQIADLAERLGSPSLAPVVAEPVDTPGPPHDPEPVAMESSTRPAPEPVGGEPVEGVGPQPAMPEPVAPMAAKPPHEPVVEAATDEPPPSEVERWLENGWKVTAARGLLAALDVKLNRTDADLTRLLARQGKSRADFDPYLYRLMTRWLRKRAAPAPADQTEALATFAAELRAALPKQSEAVAPVPPERLSPPSPAPAPEPVAVEALPTPSNRSPTPR